MEQNQMSKFCIDLEGITMPDAIAAVVEAWYDAQNGGNLAKQDHAPYQPGEPIEFRDSAKESAWKRGWVFYKVMNKKIGICQADKWNFQLNKPDYIVSGGGHYAGTGDLFISPEKSGCKMRQPQNIRRVVVQPWEKQPTRAGV
jgi:hypothetical protein